MLPPPCEYQPPHPDDRGGGGGGKPSKKKRGAGKKGTKAKGKGEGVQPFIEHPGRHPRSNSRSQGGDGASHRAIGI